jgi:hypothetical protein
VDDACELALESVDALRDNLVGIETANCFDIVEEASWDRFVVEGFVGVGGATVEIDALLVLGPRISVLVMYNQARSTHKYTILSPGLLRTSSPSGVACSPDHIRTLSQQKVPTSHAPLRYPFSQCT